MGVVVVGLWGVGSFGEKVCSFGCIGVICGNLHHFGVVWS